MLELFAAARLWLANVDPAAPAVVLMLGVFLTIYSIRRWFPRAWLWVEKTVPFVDALDYRPAATILWKAWQAWPAALLGAIASALSSGVSVAGALKGAALGAAVAVIHELARAYKGKLGDPKPKNPSWPPVAPGALLLAIVCAHTQACSSSSPKVCNPRDAVLLTADYAAKVHVLCQGFTFDACPARPALEAELNKQLEAACPTGGK